MKMAKLTMTMDGDKMCIAFFRKKQYTLTASVSPAGSGTITGGGTYDKNASVTVEATPAIDYEFDHFEVNGETVEADDEEEPPIPEDAILPQDYGGGDGTESKPWTGIQGAVNACPEGGTVYLKAGYYQLTDSIVIKNSYISIIGEGVSQTIIKTGTGDGLNLLNVDHVTIKGFSLDGALQPDKHPWYYDFAPRTIAVSNSSYLTFEDLEIKNSGSYGMNLFNMSHSLLKNVQVYDSYFHNIHPGYTNGSDPNGNSYNTYENIYVANSEIGGGFCETGNANYPNSDLHNVYINIKAEYNASNGVDISNQTGGTVTGCTATGNTKRGFPLYNIEDFTVTNCTSKDNGWQGFHVELNSNNIELNNCTATENGSEGIRIEDSTNVTLTDCTSTSNGTYGLTLLGNSDYITLDGCTLTPNKSGDIYNPNGVEITII
jgi:parallel beta-helix repeat protein